MHNEEITKFHQPCPSPYCNSSDAYCEYSDGHGFCFSCQKYFPANSKQEENHKIIDDNMTYTYEYLPLRGLTKETLKFYDIKTRIDSEGKPVAIGFRYPEGAVKVRLLEEKQFYWDKSNGISPKPGLFGRDKFAAGSSKSITITEGELDAASLYQVLRSPVVSVQSSSTAVRDCSVDIDYLRAFDSVYLAFDNDPAGSAAASSVAKLLDYRKCYLVNFSNRKDANEYLQHNEAEVLYQVWHNARKYYPIAVVSSNQEFATILTEQLREGIAYPFPTLNDLTYGIRRGESVLLTAQEGVGKTELMHAIEYQLLKETDENVGAFFLEEPKRRHLQALAGLELRRPVHLPDSGVSSDVCVSALSRLLRRDERLHLYSHFGSDNGDVLLDAIRFLSVACSCNFILFDHITMAVSGLSGDDERRALDYLSTRLEMMVKELDIALIIVSHVNDDGLTRGSRYISKIADIRIDAKRDLLNPDPVERNTTYLTVSKNRFSGKTGPAGTLLFDPSTTWYEEVANDNQIPQIPVSQKTGKNFAQKKAA